jgi:hypothetical protein
MRRVYTQTSAAVLAFQVIAVLALFYGLNLHKNPWKRMEYAMSKKSKTGRHTIDLHNRAGEVVGHAVVSPKDAAQVAFHWHVGGDGSVRRTSRENGSQTTVRLAREVMNIAVGDARRVIHKDGDLFNNTRSNLKVIVKAKA